MLAALGLVAPAAAPSDGDEPGRYQNSLTIAEEIGNRVGIATTLSQLGVLRTSQGPAADAVSYQVQALAIRAELGSPDVASDVGRLREQRAALGDRQFRRILRTLIDDEGTVAIMEATEQDD